MINDLCFSAGTPTSHPSARSHRHTHLCDPSRLSACRGARSMAVALTDEEKALSAYAVKLKKDLAKELEGLSPHDRILFIAETSRPQSLWGCVIPPACANKRVELCALGRA